MRVPPLNLQQTSSSPLSGSASSQVFASELMWHYQLPPFSPASQMASPLASSASVSAMAACDLRCQLPQQLAVDPRQWSREDVVEFLQWCEREFDLPTVDTNRLRMNGRALCMLSKADLSERVPAAGDVIHNTLQLLLVVECSRLSSVVSAAAAAVSSPSTVSGLQQRLVPVSPLTPHSLCTSSESASPTWCPQASTIVGVDDPTSTPVAAGGATASSCSESGDDNQSSVSGESGVASPTNPHSLPTQVLDVTADDASASSPSAAHPSRPMAVPWCGSPGEQLAGAGVCSDGLRSAVPEAQVRSLSPSTGVGAANANTGGGRLLWDFLQQLLNDPMQRFCTLIAWKDVQTGVFKIVDPQGLARLWGVQKNHLSMNYDKMSRALRYYYRVNILRKVQGERHCYQFLRLPTEPKSAKNWPICESSIVSSCSPNPLVNVKHEPSSPDRNLVNAASNMGYFSGEQEVPTDLRVPSALPCLTIAPDVAVGEGDGESGTEEDSAATPRLCIDLSESVYKWPGTEPPLADKDDSNVLDTSRQ